MHNDLLAGTYWTRSHTPPSRSFKGSVVFFSFFFFFFFKASHVYQKVILYALVDSVELLAE